MAQSLDSTSLLRDSTDDPFDYFHSSISNPSINYFGGLTGLDSGIDVWQPTEDPFLSSGFDRSTSSSSTMTGIGGLLFSPTSLTETDRLASEEPSIDTSTTQLSTTTATKIEISPDTPTMFTTQKKKNNNNINGMAGFNALSKTASSSSSSILPLPDSILVPSAFPNLGSSLTSYHLTPVPPLPPPVSGDVIVPGFKGKNYQPSNNNNNHFHHMLSEENDNILMNNNNNNKIGKLIESGMINTDGYHLSLESLSQRTRDSDQQNWGNNSCLSSAISSSLLTDPDHIVSNSFDAGLLNAYNSEININSCMMNDNISNNNYYISGGKWKKTKKDRLINVKYDSNISNNNDNHMSDDMNNRDHLKCKINISNGIADLSTLDTVGAGFPASLIPNFTVDSSSSFARYDSSVSSNSELPVSYVNRSNVSSRSPITDRETPSLNVPANLSLPPQTVFSLPNPYFDLEEIKPKLCGQTLTLKSNDNRSIVSNDRESSNISLISRTPSSSSTISSGSTRRRRRRQKRKLKEMNESSMDEECLDDAMPPAPKQPNPKPIANIEEYHPLEIEDGYQSADEINEPEPTFDEKVFTRRTKQDLKKRDNVLDMQTVGYAFTMTVKMPKIVNGEDSVSRMERLIRHLCEHRWIKSRGQDDGNAEIDFDSGLAYRVDKDPTVPQIIMEEKKARRGRPPKNPPPPKPIFPKLKDEDTEIARRITVALNFELLGLMDSVDQESSINVMNEDLKNWDKLSEMLSIWFGGSVMIWHLNGDAIATVDEDRYYRMKKAWFMTTREKINRKKNTRRKSSSSSPSHHSGSGSSSSSSKKKNRKK